FQGHPQIVHPEMEVLTRELLDGKNYLEPVYPSTEKLKTKSLGGRAIGKLTQTLLSMIREKDIPENIPLTILQQLKLMPRYEAYKQVHFPSTPDNFNRAIRRLKFEEFFISQLKLGRLRLNRHRFSKGVIFDKVGELFNTFYSNHLPFEL